MQSNYSNSLFHDYERLQEKLSKSEIERKFQKLRADIAESEQQRLEKQLLTKDNIIIEKDRTITEKDAIIEAQNKKILELVKKLDMTAEERDEEQLVL